MGHCGKLRSASDKSRSLLKPELNIHWNFILYLFLMSSTHLIFVELEENRKTQTQTQD